MFPQSLISVRLCPRLVVCSVPGFFRADPFDLDAECVYDHVARFPIVCKSGRSSVNMAHYAEIEGSVCTATDASKKEFNSQISTKCVRLHLIDTDYEAPAPARTIPHVFLLRLAIALIRCWLCRCRLPEAAAL